MAGDDLLDEALLDGEGLSEPIATARAPIELDILDRIDPGGRRAMVGHVTVLSSSLLALFFGDLGDVCLRPGGGRRRSTLEFVDPFREIRHLVTEEFVLLSQATVALLVRAPFLGGEGDRTNVVALAHAETGRASRIKY
jgi:hypothetical protein